MRLVKGAYWDSEIKRAQERRPRRLSRLHPQGRDRCRPISPAPARCWRAGTPSIRNSPPTTRTRSPPIAVLAGDARLRVPAPARHGRGAAIARWCEPETLGKPCRIYAPVGGHEDLLAYLVRRLLENGANTSFVNRLADDAAPVADIIADPVEKAARARPKANPRIPLPPDLFVPERRNSSGLPLWEPSVRGALAAAIREALAAPAAAGADRRRARRCTAARPSRSPPRTTAA